MEWIKCLLKNLHRIIDCAVFGRKAICFTHNCLHCECQHKKEE